MAGVEERLAGLEDEWLVAFERRCDRLEHTMRTQLRWMVGIMLTMWVSIVLTVLFK